MREYTKKMVFNSFLVAIAMMAAVIFVVQIMHSEAELHDAAEYLGLEVQYDEIFGVEEVKEVRIYIEKENEVAMKAYGDLTYSGNPPYVQADLEFEGELYENVGIRYKGQSSLYSNPTDKKSYKIEMDEFVVGQTLMGLEELVLNCNFGDPSQMREALAYFLYDQAGLPTSLFGFAEVYVNDEYIGLYTMVENVDEQYLERNFGSGDGGLFKAGNQGFFKYLGEETSIYAEAYEYKGGMTGWDSFINLIKLVDSGLDKDYMVELSQVLDVDQVLDYLAMTFVMGNMDSYMVTGHNYFIYYDLADSLYKILPWDANESFGGYGSYYDNLAWSAKADVEGYDRPLFDRLIQVPAYEEYFLDQISFYVGGIFNNMRLDSVIDGLFALIEDSVEAQGDDSSEFTYEEFAQSIYDDVVIMKEIVGYEDGVKVVGEEKEFKMHGLKSFVEQRGMYLGHGM